MQDLILTDFISPSKRFYILYLLTAGMIALIYYWKKRKIINKAMLKEYWLSDSAKLDYSYFIIVSVIRAYVLVPLVLSTQTVIMWTYKTCMDVFGYYRIDGTDRYTIMISYTLITFLVSDFSRYWLHRCMHEIPLLWNFHKIHHSATSLTPVTFYRVHPVETLLFGFRYAIVVGFVTGVFVYLFGAGVDMVDILGANAILFAFNVVGGNLRHSHVRLSYPRMVEKWFISPNQHQLHHSMYHTQRNYGGYLAIWDRMFGTLILSKETKETFGDMHFGLGPVMNKRYTNVLSLFTMPFIDMYYKTKHRFTNKK